MRSVLSAQPASGICPLPTGPWCWLWRHCYLLKLNGTLPVDLAFGCPSHSSPPWTSENPENMGSLGFHTRGVQDPRTTGASSPLSGSLESTASGPLGMALLVTATQPMGRWHSPPLAFHPHSEFLTQRGQRKSEPFKDSFKVCSALGSALMLSPSAPLPSQGGTLSLL